MLLIKWYHNCIYLDVRVFKTFLQGKDPDNFGEASVRKLLEQMDSYIPQPERELDKPFYLPIEQVKLLLFLY